MDAPFATRNFQANPPICFAVILMLISKLPDHLFYLVRKTHENLH